MSRKKKLRDPERKKSRKRIRDERLRKRNPESKYRPQRRIPCHMDVFQCPAIPWHAMPYQVSQESGDYRTCRDVSRAGGSGKTKGEDISAARCETIARQGPPATLCPEARARRPGSRDATRTLSATLPRGLIRKPCRPAPLVHI